MIMRAKRIENKICSDCGEKKPLKEYNLTSTGRRHKSYCKRCEDKLFQPKQRPRIIRQGKPLFKEPQIRSEPYIVPAKGIIPEKARRTCKECKEISHFKDMYRGLCQSCNENRKEKKKQDDMRELYSTIIQCLNDTGKTACKLQDLTGYVKWGMSKLLKVATNLHEDGRVIKEVKGRYNTYYPAQQNWNKTKKHLEVAKIE